MAIELSNITFTDEDDIVPASGVERIFNTGIANTLAGDDIINGESGNAFPSSGPPEHGAIFNTGTLNTDGGNDRITGIYNDQSNIRPRANGIYNLEGIIDTGDGNDIIMSFINSLDNSVVGILNEKSIIDMGDGDDTISSIDNTTNRFIFDYTFGIYSVSSTLNTGNGDDLITGNATESGIYIFLGTLNTGNGNDIIRGSGGSQGIINFQATFNTSGGNDIVTGTGGFTGIHNGGHMNSGDGDDIITGLNTKEGGIGIDNSSGYPEYSAIIDTGNGNDTIIGSGTGGIINYGTINTGNGEDSIIADGSAYGGFIGTGSVFLGNGKDYLKGFGSGNFNGGNGKDTLELTSGSYTVRISPAGWNFAKDGIIMNTVGFEQLIAGEQTYDFTSLTPGQKIFVA